MANASSDSYYTNVFNAIIVRLYGYGNLVIYIVGTIGNLFSLAIFLKRKWRKNTCVFYFVICLLLSLIVLNCHVLPTSLMRYWNINVHNSNTFVCKLMLYLTYLVVTIVPTILILASIDRLLISSQNVDTRLYSSRRLGYLLVGTNTVFWVLFNMHIPITASVQQLGSSSLFCSVALSLPYANFVKYSSATINSTICFLMVILSVLSFKNVRRIRAIPRQQRREGRSMTKKDFQLLRCLFVQDVVYISLSIGSTFYSVYKIITNGYRRTLLQQAIMDFVTNLVGFTYFIFYCTSFFIFICWSKAFREEVKQVIYKVFMENLAIMREEEQNHNTSNTKPTMNVVSASIVQSEF